MSGSISPFGPGYGAPYNAAAPLQIDPVTGVPLVSPAPVPQAPQVPPGDLPQWAGGSSPNPPPPAPPQMNLAAAGPASAAPPPAQLPFQGPGFSPSDITPPGAQAAPAAASPAPAPAPQQQPQTQGDPGNAGQPLSSDFYANAAPPPPAIAPLVAQAAAKYGVPENVLTWVGAHESNWTPGAVGQDTSSGKAKGMFQFMDGTAKGLGIDPMDPAQAVDGAAKYLKQLYDKTGNWTQAVKQYGTFSTGMGSQRDAAAQEGFQKFIGAAPGAPSSPQGGPPQGALPAQGQPGSSIQQPSDELLAAHGFPGISPNAYVGGPGDQLLAIGAGLAGAPSLGKGLAVAGQNELQLGQQNRDALIKQAQFKMEQARLQQQIGLQNAQLGLKTDALNNTIQHQSGELDTTRQRLAAAMAPKPTGVTTRTPDGQSLQQMRDGTGAVSWVPLQGETTRQQGVDLRTQAQSGQPKLIQQAIADNGKRVDEIDNEAEKSYNLIPQIENFRQVLNSGQTGAGTTAVDQFKRYVATSLGIPVGDTTPSSTALAQAMSAQLVNGQVSSQMRGLGLRSNNEFNTFKEGMTGLDKSPEALSVLMDQMEKGAKYNVGVFNAWHGKDPTEQEAIRKTPGGLSNFEAPLLQQYGTSRGVSPTGQGSPTVSQDAQGKWQPTTATLPGGGSITIQRIN